jgi:hypothetical protein
MRLNPWTIRAADPPIGLAHDALDAPVAHFSKQTCLSSLQDLVS